MRRVLRPAEAGLDQREPGLHEDDEDRADDDPQQVETDATSGVIGTTGHVVERFGPSCRERRTR